MIHNRPDQEGFLDANPTNHVMSATGPIGDTDKDLGENLL